MFFFFSFPRQSSLTDPPCRAAGIMTRPHTPELTVLRTLILAVMTSVWIRDSAAVDMETDGGCFYDNATGPIMYIGGNLFGSKYATNSTPDAAGCCALCSHYASIGCGE